MLLEPPPAPAHLEHIRDQRHALSTPIVFGLGLPEQTLVQDIPDVCGEIYGYRFSLDSV